MSFPWKYNAKLIYVIILGPEDSSVLVGITVSSAVITVCSFAEEICPRLLLLCSFC
jgi:hypothetical protein